MVVDYLPLSREVKMLKTYEVPGELLSDGMISMWLKEQRPVPLSLGLRVARSKVYLACAYSHGTRHDRQFPWSHSIAVKIYKTIILRKMARAKASIALDGITICEWRSPPTPT